MTKTELEKALELVAKAEKEHPHADAIEYTSRAVKVVYMFYQEPEEEEAF